MCDTVVAPPSQTRDHTMLFGKNSDRQRNEAQTVEYFPAAEYDPGSVLKCTYIAVPQVARTYATLLCRPYWIWGAEMGANEHGVVIGNEGLHARTPAPQEPALTGMDLVRLALERARTADEGLEQVISLLEQFGQGGNCGHRESNYYNNGFLIADAREAFVLETVGREWLVERVRDVRALSNVYSIGAEVERTSSGLTALINTAGCNSGPVADYAAIITNPHREHIGHAGARRARSTSLLQAGRGRLEVADIVRLLRDHGPEAREELSYRPESAPTNTICMHAGAGNRPGQTVGSFVSQISSGSGAVHWVTGSASPCLSIFKPVMLDVPLPSHGSPPRDQFDRHAFWWAHERMHRRAVLGDFPKFMSELRHERDALEASFRERVAEVQSGASLPERAAAVGACWKEAMQTEERWAARLSTTSVPKESPYHDTWLEMSRMAGIAELDG